MKSKKQISLFVAVLAIIVNTAIAQEVKPRPTKPENGGSLKTITDVSGSSQNDPQMAMKRMPIGGGLSEEWSVYSGELKFQELPYSYDALEPVIDKMTVEIHYNRHHRSYYNNFMNAIKETELTKMPIYHIFAQISEFSDAVRNNSGGYFNHALYWDNLSPKGGGEPKGELAESIIKQFGSFKDFTDKFNTAAKTRFGSGWAWLSVDFTNGELFISSTANQDNPLMNNAERMGVPILALDVWEHAYYLNYQNKRADYIEAFWKIVNWEMVEKRFKQAQKK